MSGRRVLLECSAAETRAALVIGDEIVRFWFGPAQGDESLPRPLQPGDGFLGRVRSVSKPLNGAFVDLGEGPEGFLPFGKDVPPHEGAAIAVIVKRAALGSKGPLLAAAKDGTSETGAHAAAPARLVRQLPAALQAALAFGPVEEILADQADAAALLRSRLAGVKVAIDPEGIAAADLDAHIEASLERTVGLDTGARMTVDETEALTAVDIDAGSAAYGATGKLNDKVNAAASSRLFQELSRRGIGGRIVVDFLPSSNADSRHRLMEQLRAAKRGLYDCRLGRLSADGLFDLTAPRERQSLLEQATEPAGEGWSRTGRRLTLDWQAKAAIRALESELHTRPSARVRLVVDVAVNAYLLKHPQWLERLAARYGARAELIESASLKEDRDFDIV